ncbi:MAG: hypothetical protein GKR89_17480 [Candidatus Latescibacteria bacterium]|nr:hypothetical protein [Candidatus Latescibacterota bacterium]
MPSIDAKTRWTPGRTCGRCKAAIDPDFGAASYCPDCQVNYCPDHYPHAPWHYVHTSSEAMIRWATCPKGHRRMDYCSDSYRPEQLGGKSTD